MFLPLVPNVCGSGAVATRTTGEWQEWQDRQWEPSTHPTHRLACFASLCWSLCTLREKSQQNSKAQDSPAAGSPQLNRKHTSPERKTQGDGGAVGTGRPVPFCRGRREGGGRRGLPGAGARIRGGEPSDGPCSPVPCRAVPVGGMEELYSKAETLALRRKHIG